MSTITLWSGALPNKSQSPADFDKAVEAFLAYVTTLGGQINLAIAEILVGANVTVWNAVTNYSAPTIVAGSDGNRYACVASNVLNDNPVTSVTGKWVKLTIETGSVASVQPGAIVPFALESPPTGYLECNGAAVNRTTYASLFSAIGTAHGTGDGSTTFNLPDCRGEFLRGWSHGQSTDPDKASRTNRGDGVTGDRVGTKQADGFKAHVHSYQEMLLGYGGINATAGSATGNTAANTTSIGGNETRPVNITVMYCIKY